MFVVCLCVYRKSDLLIVSLWRRNSSLSSRERWWTLMKLPWNRHRCSTGLMVSAATGSTRPADVTLWNTAALSLSPGSTAASGPWSVCLLSQWTRAWSNSTTVTRTSFVFSSRISVLNVASVSAGRGWRKRRSAFPTPSPTDTKSRALSWWRRQKTVCSGTTFTSSHGGSWDCPHVEIHLSSFWTDAVLLTGTLMAARIYTQESLTQTVRHFNMEKQYSRI